MNSLRVDSFEADLETKRCKRVDKCMESIIISQLDYQ